MVNTCVVVGCVFNYEKTRKRDATGNLLSSVNDTTDIEQRTGIFHFPKSDDLKQKWNKFVSRKDWEPTNNSVICSGHFESKYLIHGMGKQRVRLNFELDPFPTIYPAGHIPQTSTLPSASSKIPRKASTDRSTPDFKSLDDSICPNGFTFQKFDNHVVYFRLVFSKYFVPEVIESIVIRAHPHSPSGLGKDILVSYPMLVCSKIFQRILIIEHQISGPPTGLKKCRGRTSREARRHDRSGVKCVAFSWGSRGIYDGSSVPRLPIS